MDMQNSGSSDIVGDAKIAWHKVDHDMQVKYQRELDKFYTQGLPREVDKKDPTDEMYWLKYAHCMPPLDAYKLKSAKVKKGGCTKESPD